MAEAIYIPFFDDWKSWLHLLEGGALAFSPPLWAAAGALGYTMWQALEKEAVESKVGDLLEFGVGWLSGVIVRELARRYKKRR